MARQATGDGFSLRAKIEIFHNKIVNYEIIDFIIEIYLTSVSLACKLFSTELPNEKGDARCRAHLI